MTSRFFAPLLAAGLLLQAPATLAQAPPEPPRQVENVLPATSYLSVQFAGLSAFSRAAEQVKVTALGRQLLDRMGDGFYEQHVGRQLGRQAAMLRRQLERLGVDAAALHRVLDCPMALGVGRITLEGMGTSVALVVDAGGARQAVDQVMRGLQALASHYGFQGADQEIAGQRVHVLRRQGMPPVFGGYLGDYFVLTNSRGYFADISDVIAGRQAGIAQGSHLHVARDKLPEPALLSCYVNTETVMSMFDDHLPYEAGQWGRAMGVSGLNGLFLGLSGAGHGTAEIVHLGVSGSSKGLLKAAFAGPVSLAPARYCSPDTAAFAAFSLDLPAVIEAFEHVVDILPPEVAGEIRREMHREMERELRHVGFDADSLHRLVRAFGTSAAIAVNLPNTGLPVPELLAFVEVDDFDTVSQYIGMLQKMTAEEAGVRWRTRKVGETEISYCSVALPDSPIGLSPCFAWHDGYLLLSTHVRNLRAALAQAERAGESLLDEPDFRALAADAGDASALLHLRYLRGVELTWRTIETWVGPKLESMRDQVGFGSEVLPEGDELSEALGTATYSLHVDDDGIMLRERADVGFGTVLVVLGAISDHLFGQASAKVY